MGWERADIGQERAGRIGWEGWYRLGEG